MTGRVTEGLLLGHTTRAPEVVLCSEHYIVNLVRPNFGGNGNRFFATETSFQLSRLILYYLHSGVIMQAGVQVLLRQVGVTLTDGFSNLRETSI